MITRRMSTFPLILILLCLSPFSGSPQPSEEMKIFQAENRFVIDGDLTDWASIAEIPVQFAADGSVLPPSADLTVTVRFSFDAEYFYAALKVLDDRIEFPAMGRREGDGFYLAFVNPETQASKERSLI